MTYTVYSVSRYVSPEDTSYLVHTEDYHLTIVTCENGGKSRIVVRAAYCRIKIDKTIFFI